MSRTIPVIVGSGNDQKTFNIHEELLVKASYYFNVVLKSYFIEGQTQTVRLEEDDPGAFDLFAQYLYRGYYETESGQTEEGDGSAEQRWELQSRAYVLGDKLLATGFKAYIVKALRDQFDMVGVAMHGLLGMATMVYDCTPAGDNEEIRDVLADYCAENMGDRRPPRTIVLRGWTEDDRKALVASGLEDFIVDVLGKVT